MRFTLLFLIRCQIELETALCYPRDYNNKPQPTDLKKRAGISRDKHAPELHPLLVQKHAWPPNAVRARQHGDSVVHKND